MDRYDPIYIILMVSCGVVLSIVIWAFAINIKNENSAIEISEKCIAYKGKTYCEKVVE